MTLSKVSIRLNSELSNKNEKNVDQKADEYPIDEKTYTEDSLIWDNLDV